MVFLDLVAYIFRKNVHESNPGMDLIQGEDFSDLSKDFKFILYVAFPKQSEALGYDFCVKAQEYATKCGVNNFIVRARFSDQNQPRWDNEWIERAVKSDGTPKRVWVCGPPVINENFGKSLATLLPAGSYEIM